MTDAAAPPLGQKIHDLTGQVCLITGVGCRGEGWGNGLAIAALFGRQGGIVYGCTRSADGAADAQHRLRQDNPSADITVVTADATSSDDMKAFVEACVAKYARIDILVNVVGRSEPGDPATMSEDVWDEQINVNLKSVYLTCHLVLPIMEAQQRGAIVNVSSVAGLRYIGKPQVAYSATKAAILSFTRATAVIYAAKGVRLNTVVPGLIHTPLVRALADKYADGAYDDFCRVRDAQVPAGRMGNAWEVAHAALFLASREASYITGTEIIVDGGLVQSTGRP